ncbi:hypothetical protein [Lacticaseibacillus songhuajiangensis]|jgi:hypothetical protein|uniref:hypothetical protein n=1 Tax=Lacticaseibacillus songhuajiangensis TaxID=1296539 RepID=UPI000F780320|nr:hypothetical protein [Lacticaseibacillus songhuajiangensis]
MDLNSKQLNSLSEQLDALRDDLTGDWEAAYRQATVLEKADAPDSLPDSVKRLMQRAVAAGRIAGSARRLAERIDKSAEMQGKRILPVVAR